VEVLQWKCLRKSEGGSREAGCSEIRFGSMPRWVGQ